MEYYIISAVMMLAGGFTVFCAAMNFDWYMNSRKAERMSSLIGRNAARILYIVIGALIIIIAGIVLATDIFKN